MKQNIATLTFLSILTIALVISAFRLRSIYGTLLFPLLVFSAGLYSAIKFLDWVNNLAPTSKWFSVAPFIRKLTKGAKIPFWHRQFIFFGGFGLTYLYLVLRWVRWGTLRDEGRSQYSKIKVIALLTIWYRVFMPRSSILDAPGALHHIIARGIGRRKIFNDHFDRDVFWIDWVWSSMRVGQPVLRGLWWRTIFIFCSGQDRFRYLQLCGGCWRVTPWTIIGVIAVADTCFKTATNRFCVRKIPICANRCKEAPNCTRKKNIV